MDLRHGQPDRFGDAHTEGVDRLHHSGQEVTQRRLGLGQHAAGEDRCVGGREEERCAAQAPGLQQGLLFGDRISDLVPGDVLNPGMKRQ